MSEGTAVAKTPEELKKEAEEKAKDEAAAELLKEMDDLEADDDKKKKSDTKDKSSDADDDTGDGKDDKSGTSEGENDDDASDSQSDKGKPKVKTGYKRRVDRLTKQREEAKGENAELLTRLRNSEEKNKLLELKVSQGVKREPAKPNPSDFDDEEDDPKYIAAKKAYDEAKMDKLVTEKVQQATKTIGQQQSVAQKKLDLEKKQESHWEKADKLGVDDYDDKEEKLVKTLGTDMVNNIIDYFPKDSHNLVYYLGTNQEAAEEMGEMLADRNGPGMVQGVAELGRIIEKIKAKPLKSKTNPDPDTESEGSESSPQETLQLRLDKLRDEAAKSGRKDGMKRILEFKRKARARGITLR